MMSYLPFIERMSPTSKDAMPPRSFLHLSIAVRLMSMPKSDAFGARMEKCFMASPNAQPTSSNVKCAPKSICTVFVKNSE